MHKVSDEYVAGFFDGEGSLCLARGGSYRYKGDPRVPTYRASLTLTNTKRQVLDLICSKYGIGAVYSRRGAKANHSECHFWMAEGTRILPVLQAIRPFVIVKSQQVEVAIEFINRRLEQRTRPFTEVDYDLVKRMQGINARAPGRGTPIQPVPEPRQSRRWQGHKVVQIP